MKKSLTIQVVRYLLSFGVLLAGVLIPKLPYVPVVIPFVILGVGAWLSFFRAEDLSIDAVLKKSSGILFSLFVIGTWAEMISTPEGAIGIIFYLPGAILILPLTYYLGGTVGLWLIKLAFPFENNTATNPVEKVQDPQTKENIKG